MIKALKLCGVLLCTAVVPSAANAEVLSFQCSWNQKAPLTITVDTSSMSALRDDGGTPYRVVKVSKWGVWLLVNQPNNVVVATVQMIERSSAFDDPGRPGKWVDVFIAITGSVSPIEGGVCWERGGR
ncbi:hypothetical protein [Mesorhizobium sp.]|uniref:hypothetical protein n=1 Tax=Mesorhizobium sp. TaxID=1871066 RepID=UPI000FE75CAC|nr:hypothetical protein [Mesorhizobium sp.]RWK61956.1 MAG: hypothetical protein EOR49_14490 [Mesorhizobium sp.]RWM49228.1 MAG: hypothetical protein EOR76_10100 [Mesorhizobium sp.]RWM57642.1 MAG: hypothetical protein EOR79_15040 [Mesorhizobium sp.]RWN04225.1 MAG: hypothetical protein EOR85_05580 [Mesorhizobium sp.]TIO70566.1 MAG: hypothetical protein E5X85_06445 [Mesorhizobium sp.]